MKKKKKAINSLLRRRSHEATRCSCSVISTKIRRRRRSNRSPSSLKTKKINTTCFFLLLPVEIAADIFSRLSVDSVLQYKLVCKTWRDILKADHHHSNNNNNSIVEKAAAAAGGFLLRIHYKEPGLYYGEYDEKQQVPTTTYNFNLTKKTIFNHQYPFQDIRNWHVVGSCNGFICLRRQKLRSDNCTSSSCEQGTDHGLICLPRQSDKCTSSSCEHGTDHYHDDMYVCNPYTGEYVKLPDPSHPRVLLNYLPPSREEGRAHGFGYHPITKEYKVIRIYYHSGGTFIGSSPTEVNVQVYTLGSDTSAWRSIGEIRHKLCRSFQRGSASHNTSWGILLNGVLYWLTEKTRQIISFDLADHDEKFQEISTTPDFRSPSCVLGVLNGCLCFSTGMNESTRIWVMNDTDYSWSMKFSISWRNNFRPYFPLAHLESGKILLHCNFNGFFSYDPETEHAVKLKMRDRFYDIIIPYMKSTVSLKALGEKEAIQVTSI